MITDRVIQVVLLGALAGAGWFWHGAASVRDQAIIDRDTATERNGKLVKAIEDQNEGIKQYEAVTLDALARASAAESALRPVLRKIDALGATMRAKPPSTTCGESLARQRAAIEGLRK